MVYVIKIENCCHKILKHSSVLGYKLEEERFGDIISDIEEIECVARYNQKTEY